MAKSESPSCLSANSASGALDLDFFSRGECDASDLDAQLQHPVVEGRFRELQQSGGLREAFFIQHLGNGPLERPAQALLDVEHLFGLPDGHIDPFLHRPAPLLREASPGLSPVH